MNHPYYEAISTDSALLLARSLLHGPIPSPNDPTPTIDQAIQILSSEIQSCWFVWITGRASLEILKLTQNPNYHINP